MMVHDQSLMSLHSICSIYPTLKDMGEGPVLQLQRKKGEFVAG